MPNLSCDTGERTWIGTKVWYLLELMGNEEWLKLRERLFKFGIGAGSWWAGRRGIAKRLLLGRQK